jgi:hypothetical protein
MNAVRRRRPSGPTWAIERVLVRSREVRIAFFGAIGRSRASLVTTPTRKGPELHREGEPRVVKSWGCTPGPFIPYPLMLVRILGAPEAQKGRRRCSRNRHCWG